ncbi:MAG: GIY-YIG nuclease family protein [Oscillospiraceae bacterium]|nr:GIY-YIG nuclease family protein [Oscillospiraceae bacterium]
MPTESDCRMEYTVYMLRCADGTLYTGITNDLTRRIAVHNSGKGAKYTRGRLPVKLVYSAPCPNKSEALRMELVIKRMNRREKEALLQIRRADF